MRIPTTMRAWRQTSLDGVIGLRFVTDAPVPVPRPGEVLFRVEAADVNFFDISRAHGTFGEMPAVPFVAGFEAAGHVVAVGDARPTVGTRVIGVGPGAFAEYMVLPAAAVVPPGWTPAQALGLAVTWPTALTVLEVGRLGAQDGPRSCGGLGVRARRS